MTSATQSLADFCAETDFSRFDRDTVHAAKRHILDTLGAIIAGGTQVETRQITAAVNRWSETGKVVVPGAARRYDPFIAAYLIGAAGHGIEVDDGYRAGSVHPGVVTLPALLSAVQLQKSSGGAFIAAVVVGYEITARLAREIFPASRVRGFHNTAIVGPLASAAAVGALRKHTSAMFESAFGLAASTAGGLFAFLHGGGDVKRLHSAHAGREGLLSALLAEEHIAGPRGVFESKDGFLQAFGGKRDTDKLLAGLGGPGIAATPLAVTQCYTKPYACCRHLHPALDAVLDMLASDGLAIADIGRIDIGTYAIGAEHGHIDWADMPSAQMSYRYSVATTLVNGKASLACFDDAHRQDARIAPLANNVFVTVDEECERIYPGERSAKVRITGKDGKSVERFVRDPYGSATNPMSDAAILEKFHGLVAPVFGAERAQAIADLVMRLDGVADMRELIALLDVAYH